MTHSPLFEKYKERYEKGWCTKEQLQKLVSLGALTQEEYDKIVNPKESE